MTGGRYNMNLAAPLLAILLLSAPSLAAIWEPPPVTRATGLQGTELGLVINTDDPDSEITAKRYRQYHRLGTANVVRVSLGYAESVSRERFQIAEATVKAAMGPHVQALALLFRLPARVGSYNSITSAFARGYYERSAVNSGSFTGYLNPYRLDPNRAWQGQLSVKPFSAFNIRPAMMVSGSTRFATEQLIIRGAWAEGTRPPADAAWMSTTDTIRSVRTRGQVKSQVINGINLRIVAGNTYPDADPVMFYFQGLAVIPDLRVLTYGLGAWVDTLTSCGGMLNGCGGQTTVWSIIDAGATGSYGTVEEPYAIPSKFIDPPTFVRIYSSGVTLIEAAWRSVSHPYQGLFIGDPLAAPYGRPER